MRGVLMKQKKKAKIIMLAVLGIFLLGGVLAAANLHTVQHFLKEKRDLMGECVPVLAYHGFVPQNVKDQYYPDNKWIDSTERFEKQMKYLNDNGWTTLTLDEFYDWQQNGKEIPKKSCLITFDDGYYEMYYQILPILKKYHFNGASFVVGSYTPDTTPAYDPAQRHMIGWDKIHEVESSYPGLQFESHSYNLHGFDKNGNEPWKTASLSKLRQDFASNDAFGFQYMAYPYGGFNDNMLKAAEESHIKMAFTFKTPNYATQRCSPYKIPRQKITAETSFNEFKKILEKTQ